MLKSWIQRMRDSSRRLLSDLEWDIIHAIKQKLPATWCDALDNQLTNNTKVTRDKLTGNVTLYVMLNGTMPLPVSKSSPHLAQANFTLIGAGTFTATLCISNGYIYEISYSSTFHSCQSSRIKIESITVLALSPDEFEISNLEAVCKNAEQFLQSVGISQPPARVQPPLSVEDRSQLIKEHKYPFPSDYLELMSRCDGLYLRHLAIIGLSDVYEIELPSGTYLVLGEIIASDTNRLNGVIGIDATAPSSMYYLGYDGDIARLGLQLRDILNWIEQN